MILPEGNDKISYPGILSAIQAINGEEASKYHWGCWDEKSIIPLENSTSFEDIISSGKNKGYYYVIPERNVLSFSSGVSFIILQSSKKLSFMNINLFSNVLTRFLTIFHQSIYSQIIKLSNCNSAIGSIMSRNGSHNIGSHVLSALSHNVGTMPDDRVLYQYIQHRMDYIASATTGAPDWSVSTPFVANLMKMFYSQRHLLEHIAGSDGLHAYKYQGKGTQTGVWQKDCVKIIVRKIERYKEEKYPKGQKNEGWQGKKCADGSWIYAYEFFRDAPAKQKDSISLKSESDDLQSKETANDKNDDNPKTVNWNLDEVVSVPGGILGQHAFYNIVENVLRNAAKHSWAGKSAEKREAVNLEIYIDFEKTKERALKEDGKDEEMICFTVGDNMSKLFQDKFWEELFDKFNNTDSSWPGPSHKECSQFTGKSLPSLFAQPLDDFSVPADADSNCKHIKDFLKGTGNADSLPPLYRALYAYISDNANWSKLKNDKSFIASLKGERDKNENGEPMDEQLGHRLPLPLHHQQELALSEPFIDLTTNRLRQAAWGVSEMKISAGYLRRAKVAVIGGLKPDVGQRPLIVPIGIPRSELEGKSQQDTSDGNTEELSYQHLCLAYRFWVKLPKYVLIVADNTAEWSSRISGDEWEGIRINSFVSVFGEGGNKGDIGKMSDYEFVLVDHHWETREDEIKKREDVIKKLPFRFLLVDNFDVQNPSVAKEELLNKKDRIGFVKSVYRAWLDYLIKLRLWNKAPRNVQIVTDVETRWKNITEYKWQGIGLVKYSDVFGDSEHKEGNNSLMSGCDFVLIDHDGGLRDDELEKLPFRFLPVVEHSAEARTGVVRTALEQAHSREDFVMSVHKAWQDYLRIRSSDNGCHSIMTIKLNIYDEAGGEKGLISDRDVYKVLFRECLHSILEPIAADQGRPVLERKALLLVSLYPLNEDDDLFDDVKEKEYEHDHFDKMAHLLGTISGKVWEFWKSLPSPSEKLKGVYKSGLERTRKDWGEHFIPKELLKELGDKHPEGDSALLDELKAMEENPLESSIIESAAEALLVARTTSDVFLRKYEERIVTLPLQYKSEVKKKSSLLSFKDIGVNIDYSVSYGDISYNRHSTDSAPFYSEPLSGSQTYLNALSDLSNDDAKWAMRLAENGLLRIVIIDERVYAFIKDHGEEIIKTYESMHIAVVDTERPYDHLSKGTTSLPDFKDWYYVAGGRHADNADKHSEEQPDDHSQSAADGDKVGIASACHDDSNFDYDFDYDFDLVIIHQGIIDKWWPDKHNKSDVEGILDDLRTRNSAHQNAPNRFVVVTTGRGRPDNIPDNEKVLAFSMIEAFLFKRYPEKLNLVNSIMNILPGSAERNYNND